MMFVIIKALHLFSAFAWMAAAWYLPRILIYQNEFNEKYKQRNGIEFFHKMASRLLTYILIPAMIFTLTIGLLLAIISGAHTEFWFIIKLILIVIFIVYSITLAFLCRAFYQGRYTITNRSLRWLNETPTLILIAILFITIVYPAV